MKSTLKKSHNKFVETYKYVFLERNNILIQLIYSAEITHKRMKKLIFFHR